jgi:predicted porin
MKRSLLALAILGASAGIASAQSSVSLSGTLDVNAKYVKNDGSDRRYALDGNGLNSSQLVFKGTEDLGDGLKAGFVLNSAIFADTGTTNATKFWNRRATVSLIGKFGEVRLGRDYTPTYHNTYTFDAFGDNGVGASDLISQVTTGTVFRADNSIAYFLPSGIGGVYGQAMVAASEGAATNPGRYVGVRVGWAGGPVDVAAAYGTQRLDLTVGQPSEKTANIGASYNFGVAKLLGYYARETVSFTGVDTKENRGSFSVVVPIGVAEIHASYGLSKRDTNGVSTKVDHFALGGVYNLSTRTAVYATASRLNNKDGTHLSVASGSAQTAAPTGAAGSSLKSSGVEFGLRHFF